MKTPTLLRTTMRTLCLLATVANNICAMTPQQAASLFPHHLRADTEAVQNSLNWALHEAVDDDNLEAVQQLVNTGAAVDTLNSYGMTPLYKAAACGHVQIARVLLEHGAAVDTLNNGDTSLHIAAMNGHVELTKLLIDNGADVNTQDKKDVHDFSGRTPLHYTTLMDRVETAKLLIEHGATVNMPNNDGRTPLHYAATKGYIEITKLLVASGANVNAPDNNGWTPLYDAFIRSHVDVAQWLIAYGATLPDSSEYYELYLAQRAQALLKPELRALFLKNHGINNVSRFLLNRELGGSNRCHK